MKLRIYYVDFHWDNYQGGSGKSFELTCTVTVPDDLPASGVLDFIQKTIDDKAKRERPFQQQNCYSVQRVEIV